MVLFVSHLQKVAATWAQGKGLMEVHVLEHPDHLYEKVLNSLPVPNLPMRE